MHVRLLIPDLFPPDPAFIAVLAERRFPALETLVARARRGAGDWHSLEQWLLECFSVERQQDWPSAPFALLGDRGEPGEAFWMHAEPVHLRPEMESIRLADASMLEISLEEADALAGTLNRHFGPALQVAVRHPKRWYARVAEPPAEPTVPIAEVADRSIAPGSASLRWNTVMNEIQMLLHEHPVNAERELRGDPAINGIWLWGGGRLAPLVAPPLRSLMSESPLALGLAANAGLRASFPPEDLTRWIESGDRGGVHLAVLPALTGPAHRRDAEGWCSAVEMLERQWFAPLQQALRAGRIGMVTLHLASDARILNAEATRSDLRHFWHRRRPLADYCAPR